MDLFELLLIVVFFILPLIQQLLEQRKRGGRSLPPADEEHEHQHEEEELVAFPPPIEPREVEDGWSAGWGDWPGFGVEEAEEETPVEQEAAAQPLAREEISADLAAPEAVRVEDPVVSLEPLLVDRSRHPARERARVHERNLAPVPPRARPAHPPTPPRARTLLRDPADLRRAVLVGEVLGPPRALNPPQY